MKRLEKNLLQQTATFEPSWNGQHGLIPRKKPTAKIDDGLVSKNSRGDWIRTSDLLNPILWVKAAPSRRMSQMQAFWRLTDFTHHTVYADHGRKSTTCPHFPGFSVPRRARIQSAQ
jgi:hypothetical protein